MKITVMGAGAFGTALAISFSAAGPVTLWARDLGDMPQSRIAPRLPGAVIPDAVTITSDQGALDSDVLLLAMPMQALADVVRALPTRPGQMLVACCKGIDLSRHTGPGSLIAELAPWAVPAVLTGPSFAEDIARHLPTALVLACPDEEKGRAAQARLATRSLRIYRSTDMRGAELGGALKNVIAIACGVAVGAGMGDSARAALMTRGFAEMQRLAGHFGADPRTLMGLSGFGDLVLTASSEQSRNYGYGLALGRGEAFDPNKTVEGIATARATAELAQEQSLDMPITAQIARLTTGTYKVEEALAALLSRPLKEE